MIWPTISGKSYVGETVKSMTTESWKAPQKDYWLNISVTPIKGQ